MNKYNPKIHHRRSIRLKGYDYASAGLYFITICCQDRASLFGAIKNGEMIFNEYGQIAFNEWVKTPTLRTNVELGEFVIMPNHIHGIIRLLDRGESHSPENESVGKTPQRDNSELHSPDNMELYSPDNNESHSPENEGVCKTPQLRSPSQTIGSIVRGYKSSVTKQLNLLNIDCVVWQRNYYEHIIRDECAYQNISAYIINNPSKWTADKFYSQKI